ncbi:DUF7019 family protein [Sedimentisphaera salicampi]|uniref:DUF7019 family protein n=1 Tax=Sedimentisphaera salicampi TaxID=1941349 RepID=UPI000B9A6DA3|nr:hypothetical protein [Sedimentisphaera salicampi]OXU14532.1 hypothetical protein SMSP1_01709 [Sedimentisphaera salicampi]
MNYYHYISASKLDMLSAQVKRPRLSLKGVKSKFSGGFASLEVEAEGRKDALVQKLTALIKELEAQNQIKSVGALEYGNTSVFYRDEATYHCGIFCMDSMCESPIATYVCWRSMERTLILLVGSPLNVLSERHVDAQCYIPGTSGAHDALHEFADRILQTDERTLVVPRKPKFYRETPKGYRPPDIIHGFQWPKDPEAEVTDREQMHREEQFLRYQEYDGDKGLSLSLLVLGAMSRLPERSMDITFRVLDRHTIPSMETIKNEDRWYAKYVKEDVGPIPFSEYDTIVVGSPLCTALR